MSKKLVKLRNSIVLKMKPKMRQNVKPALSKIMSLELSHLFGLCSQVNWRKHEEMCKIGRVKRRSIYKQEVDETGQVVKRPRPKPRPKKPKVEGVDGVEGGEGGEEESKDMKAPKEVKECLICLKKVGNQWERHIKLHKERVGDKLYEQTVCPSWDCEQIFEDRYQQTAANHKLTDVSYGKFT